MNKVTRGTYKNNKFLKYSFYLAVFLIIILFFSQILNQNQKSSLLEEISYDLSVDYEKCTLTSNTLIHYYESKVSVPNFFQSTKSLSLFPEIENIKCLGKVTDIKSIRPGYGLASKYFNKILGKKVKKNISRGTAVKFNLIKV